MIAELQVIPSPCGTEDDEYCHVNAAIAVIARSGLKHQVAHSRADDWPCTAAAADLCINRLGERPWNNSGRAGRPGVARRTRCLRGGDAPPNPFNAALDTWLRPCAVV